MKKLVLIFVAMLITVAAKSQGLESNGQYIKDNFPNAYEKTIKKHALAEWGNDYSMVVYEINKQSDALVSLIDKFESDNTNIAFQAIQEWSIDGYKSSNIEKFRNMDTFDLKSLIKFHCDWSMVKYEYDKQVKAKNSF
jgi:hypothetical protein